MAPARASSSGLPQGWFLALCPRCADFEGYVEDKSKGAMLRFEDSLPRLPVPSLDETAKRYLKSLHPLLTRSELDYSKRAVADFIRPGGQGEELQKRLIGRRDNPDVKNWIIEWWNDSSYLGWRDPVVPYSSYFYSHRDDRRRRDPAKRAAAITTAVLEFKRQVDEKTLEPEYMRKLPMAMSSYEFMFNACRVPAKPSDYPVQYDPQDNAHIIVMRKNQFFKVQHVVGGKQLNTTELEAQFRKIYANAEKSPPIGVLTSQHRDAWTDVRWTSVACAPLT
jgi:carnitine O-acetyltransferase